MNISFQKEDGTVLPAKATVKCDNNDPNTATLHDVTVMNYTFPFVFLCGDDTFYDVPGIGKVKLICNT